MAADVTLDYHNAHRLQILAEDSFLAELADHFSYFVKGFRYMPLFRKGVWDGKHRLINLRNQTACLGLWQEITNFCRDSNKTVIITERLAEATGFGMKLAGVAAANFISTLALPQQPRDFQMAAIQEAARSMRVTIKCPTGSGKSQIMYCIHRWLEDFYKQEHKMLVVVPTVKLVNQLASDIKDYAQADTWDPEEKVHLIYSGKEKINLTANIFVSTWQSVFKLSSEYLSQFTTVIVDEAHGAKAASLEKLLSKCLNTEYRIGLTGTIEDEASKLQIVGCLGPIFEAATTAELQERKILAQLTVYCVVLNYHPDDCAEWAKIVREAKKDKTKRHNFFNMEMEYIKLHNTREDFLIKMVCDLRGNKLILAVNRDTHVIPLHERLLEEYPEQPWGLPVFVVHGKVDADEAESIRKTINELDDSVTVATYGSFQAGINIPRLNRLFFGSPTKSEIRTLQSIGRVLRMGEGKDSATLYDLVDNLTHKRKKNFAMKHFQERLKFYNREGFRVKFVEVSLKKGAGVNTGQVNLLESLSGQED